MHRRHHKTSHKAVPPDVFDASTIIRLMADAGARIRLTPGRCLVIGGLGKLPAQLQALFLNFSQPALLVAAAKEHIRCTELNGQTTTA